jgi:hypothetical protein
MIKVCSKCKVEKPLEEFHKHKATKDGRQSYCKKCSSLRGKEAYNSEEMAEYHLNRRYGITLEDYDNLLLSQGGGCAICGSDDSGGRGRFSIDHNHETGEVRGLLCGPCNRGLGYFKDSPDVLESAKEYLLERGNYGA